MVVVVVKWLPEHELAVGVGLQREVPLDVVLFVDVDRRLDVLLVVLLLGQRRLHQQHLPPRHDVMYNEYVATLYKFHERSIFHISHLSRDTCTSKCN